MRKTAGQRAKLSGLFAFAAAGLICEERELRDLTWLGLVFLTWVGQGESAGGSLFSTKVTACEPPVALGGFVPPFTLVGQGEGAGKFTLFNQGAFTEATLPTSHRRRVDRRRTERATADTSPA